MDNILDNDNIEVYYKDVIERIKRLPAHRKHLFLLGIRAEYATISRLQNMLEENYTVEVKRDCNCSTVWNVVVGVR